jgi:hypothetical protein
MRSRDSSSHDSFICVILCSQFGKVYLAETEHESQPVKVAVKLLRTKSSAPDKEEFLAEAEMMLSIDSEFFIRVSSFVLPRRVHAFTSHGWLWFCAGAWCLC